jgi:hypothetical protein
MNHLDIHARRTRIAELIFLPAGFFALGLIVGTAFFS